MQLDDPSTVAEVIYAIQKCKNHKAAGPDNLVIECSKIIIRLEQNQECQVTEYAKLITTLLNSSIW